MNIIGLIFKVYIACIILYKWVVLVRNIEICKLSVWYKTISCWLWAFVLIGRRTIVNNPTLQHRLINLWRFELCYRIKHKWVNDLFMALRRVEFRVHSFFIGGIVLDNLIMNKLLKIGNVIAHVILVHRHRGCRIEIIDFFLFDFCWSRKFLKAFFYLYLYVEVHIARLVWR